MSNKVVSPELSKALASYKEQSLQTLTGFSPERLRSNELSVVNEALTLNFVKDYFEKGIGQLIPICPPSLSPPLQEVLESHIDFCAQVGQLYGEYRALFDVCGPSLSQLSNLDSNTSKGVLNLVNSQVQKIRTVDISRYNKAIGNFFKSLTEISGNLNYPALSEGLKEEEENLYKVQSSLSITIAKLEFAKAEEKNINETNQNASVMVKFYKDRLEFLQKELTQWEEKSKKAKLNEKRTTKEEQKNTIMIGFMSAYSSQSIEVVDTTWEQQRCAINIENIKNQIKEIKENIDSSVQSKTDKQATIKSNIESLTRKREEELNNYYNSFEIVKKKREDVRQLSSKILSEEHQRTLNDIINFLVSGVTQFTINLNSIKGYAERFSELLQQATDPGMIQVLDFAKVIARSAAIGDILQTHSVHFLTDESTREISRAQLACLNKVAQSPHLHNAPGEVRSIMETTKKEYQPVKAEVPLW